MAKTYIERYFSKYATDLVKAQYDNDVNTFLEMELDNFIR